MDIFKITTTPTPPPVLPVASTASSAGPDSAVVGRRAWFDANGDGRIDNVPTSLGGDGYLPDRPIAPDPVAERVFVRHAVAAPQARARSSPVRERPPAAAVAAARAAYQRYGASPADAAADTNQ